MLFAMLMPFTGGRVIAPAAAGAIERAGGHLEARVQPRIEGVLLVGMACAVVLAALPDGRATSGVAEQGVGIDPLGGEPEQGDALRANGGAGRARALYNAAAVAVRGERPTQAQIGDRYGEAVPGQKGKFAPSDRPRQGARRAHSATMQPKGNAAGQYVSAAQKRELILARALRPPGSRACM